MGTYRNDYKKSEDECLWEIHEIRHHLHEELKKETFKEINDRAKSIFNDFKKKYTKSTKSAIQQPVNVKKVVAYC